MTRTTTDEVAIIRRLIKAKVPTVSVRRGQGTASGWVDIRGSGDWGNFTDGERAGLKALGFQPGGNFENIAPDARAFWIKKLGGEPEAERLPKCIVCRAEAVEDFGCNCDLTHWLCAEHLNIPRRDCAFIIREIRG